MRLDCREFIQYFPIKKILFLQKPLFFLNEGIGGYGNISDDLRKKLN